MVPICFLHLHYGPLGNRSVILVDVLKNFYFLVFQVGSVRESALNLFDDGTNFRNEFVWFETVEEEVEVGIVGRRSFVRASNDR